MTASETAQRQLDAYNARDPAQHAELLKRTVIGGFVVDHETVTRTYPEGVGRYELLATYEVRDGFIQSATFVFGEPVFSP